MRYRPTALVTGCGIKVRRALAIFLQNQVSVSFQVDIHPAAKIGRGIMLDHATGICGGGDGGY
ncbi:serine acetyltransferase [Salmonella enterica subsp. enterica]|uniref:Serine acetyltransferase n=1 Tax=Salmonella enterica I TaxID=59201 RepID=A0A3S4FBK1_SALET|nr:serine acetyltransferase [Salmonella enterica subsp. enterica]